ncbi:hypothetical protein L6164_031975 [Bauhinia variegata]|uniref:Uncharacterized protein n=1 Tax=Bauhinia variegata TaxID=167791 RepID=A0ACB9KMP0_BAUVA|nr:hypothetical protein L6164_031975 [Bauhinia variegata]
MKPVITIYDLIEEAKIRTVWWALFIFSIAYFLTHTSKSMWMNIPMSILFASALRFLVNNVEFHWKVQAPRSETYLSHLEKKQLSPNDSRVSTTLNPAKWNRKIDSPIVENALDDFMDKLLKDFVVDLWYSEITPDREAPELIREIIMDALGEISTRVKEINIVDLFTRDIIDLVGDHFELFRRNQAAIGVDVMLTLSSEERDERIKYHLLNSKELHPALISPESEYKVLQRLMGGVLGTVLRPREAQCPIVRSIAREILTCLVMQPIMNLASPGYINELLETLLLFIKEEGANWVFGDQSTNATSHSVAAGGPSDHASSNKNLSANQEADLTSPKMHYQGGKSTQDNTLQQECLQGKPADWARMLEAATQRRTEVLMPENLENMWTKGRNYKKKEKKYTKASIQDPPTKIPVPDNSLADKNLSNKTLLSKPGMHAVQEGKSTQQPIHELGSDPLLTTNGSQSSMDTCKELSYEGEYQVDEVKDANSLASNGYKGLLKRSNSTSALAIQPVIDELVTSEMYCPDFERHTEGFPGLSASDMVIRREGQLVPKLKCRVMGAYFEKLGSQSFAVYSIAVTDENKTWFVKRRYRNFERLHRHLKDIPNYTLHLPPKRIFYSSTEDAFVHQRCIQLNKYLQELLSIANVAEQHEVWDFLSASSKNYSFGKSASMMKTLAVNVDDAVDDIVRQFRGVSDGFMRKVVGASSPTNEGSSTSTTWNLSCNADETDRSTPRQVSAETVFSSDNEDGGNLIHEDIDKAVAEASESHSDNELSSKGYRSQVINHAEESVCLDPDRKLDSMVEAGVGKDVTATNFTLLSNDLEDPVGVPPEWAPPNVSVPLLNLVDKIFQLNKRGWLRRQAFWISKQILQLVMEDAIDDFLLRQIHWLRREDTIAQGISWLQDVLWPGGTFFLKVGDTGIDQSHFPKMSEYGRGKLTKSASGSFEQQLEAARRASDIKKFLFDGAPTALVSFIGQKQYRRCARDIYHFSQSTICVKQLAYAILELVLVSIFPEMRNLVQNIHRSG